MENIVTRPLFNELKRINATFTVGIDRFIEEPKISTVSIMSAPTKGLRLPGLLQYAEVTLAFQYLTTEGKEEMKHVVFYSPENKYMCWKIAGFVQEVDNYFDSIRMNAEKVLQQELQK